MNAAATLKAHAKTFFWAWLILPRARRGIVAELYQFCREVDDLADGEDADRGAKLETWRKRIEDGRDPRVARIEAAGVRREWILDLIDGARGDVEFRQPRNEFELELYGYRVAGVVGLMMCPLLGVTDPAAWRHAVDLGTAMQLTNIARDVAEDQRMGRCYLPREWTDANLPVATHVMRLLRRADELYESGKLGFRYLPRRARLSIAVATRLYRAIGGVLARQGYDPARGRAVVGFRQKIWLTLKETFLPRRYARDRASHNLAWGGPGGVDRLGRD